MCFCIPTPSVPYSYLGIFSPPYRPSPEVCTIHTIYVLLHLSSLTSVPGFIEIERGRLGLRGRYLFDFPVWNFRILWHFKPSIPALTGSVHYTHYIRFVTPFKPNICAKFHWDWKRKARSPGSLLIRFSSLKFSNIMTFVALHTSLNLKCALCTLYTFCCPIFR